MNRKTWIAAGVLLLCAGAAGGYWWMYLQPTVERTTAAKLRATKKLAMDTKLQKGNYYDEEMKQDVKSLADSFKIIPTDGPVRTDSKVSVAVYDLEEEYQLILWVFPPDVVNLGGTLHRVSPDFWKTLLANAPKTVEFLKKTDPKVLAN